MLAGHASHQASPSPSRSENLNFKRQKPQDLGKPGSRVWKRGQLLPHILCWEHTFPFFPSEICRGEWDAGRDLLTLCNCLRMRLLVLSPWPGSPCSPTQSCRLWSLMVLCRGEEQDPAAVVMVGRSTQAGLLTKEAHRTAQQEQCHGL